MEKQLIQGISLQINLSPSDYMLAKCLLAHQIEFFYYDVDEVVLTLETKKSRGKKFGSDFYANEENIKVFLQDLTIKYPKIRVVPVDYSIEVSKEMAKAFFSNCKYVPLKDYRGGPFYSYFFGLFSCKYRYVFHIDCDMFLSGDFNQWLIKAKEELSNPSILFINPFPGPPREDFTISNNYIKRINKYKYLFASVSTRIFFTDIFKFMNNKIKLCKVDFNIRSYIRGALSGNFWELPEKLLSYNMINNKKYRLDYWGDTDGLGCYSLHPLDKSLKFISYIPIILTRIKNNDLPSNQYGHYNIVNNIYK